MESTSSTMAAGGNLESSMSNIGSGVGQSLQGCRSLRIKFHSCSSRFCPSQNRLRNVRSLSQYYI